MEACSSTMMDNFCARIASVRERATLLVLIEEFRKLLEEDRLDTLKYSTILRAFLEQMKPSIFGQITESEFVGAFGSVLCKRSPRDTISLLVHSISSIGSGDAYKFSKVMHLLDSVMDVALWKVLSTPTEKDRDPFGSNEQFSRDLCSLSDRVYNFLGSAESNVGSTTAGINLVQKYEAKLLGGIQRVLLSSQPFDVALCARIVADYSFISHGFIQEFVSWVLADERSFDFDWSLLFLNAEIGYQRQEQLVVKLVQLIPNKQGMRKIFAGSALCNANLRRIFTKKLLIERILQPSSKGECRVSQKIAGYFADVGPRLVTDTLIQLLHVFADQSQLLESVNFAQQLQLCTAIIDFAKEIRKDAYADVRDDVIQLLVSAVPEYLQLADVTRRQMGMFLAETLANRFGCTEEELHFDYTDDAILLDLKSIVNDDCCSNGSNVIDVSATSRSNHAVDRESAAKKKQTFVDARTRILDSDDDEDCDKMDCLELEEDDQITKGFSYLRECLDSLGEKENFANFSSALRALPKFLVNKSTGENDMALELLDQLIRLEDRFRMPEFSELRSQSVILLLSNHPELAAHIIRILFSNQCCMANRYFVLDCLEKAAQRLGLGESLNHCVSENPLEGKSKQSSELGKIIWRAKPEKPANLSKNNFTPVASLFMYPLLDFKHCGPHLELYDKDHVLLGKILFTLGQLLLLAKYSPSIMRFIGSMLSTLQSLRSNPHSFVTNAALFCYASIAETPNVESVFANELEDCIEWISKIATPDRLAADPNLRQLVELSLANISRVLRRDEGRLIDDSL